MTAVYTLNAEKNGIEIRFESKPAAAVLDAIKSAGYRWSRSRRLWWAHQSPKALETAQAVTEGRMEEQETKDTALALDLWDRTRWTPGPGGDECHAHTVGSNYKRGLSNDEYRPTLSALELMTGHKWDTCTIRGSCQGDWQEVYYDTTLWSREALDELEIEYFNEGAEWIVHDEDEPPESPEDVSGFCTYTHAWDDDGIRREIAEAAGGDPRDVVLYKFTGWSRSACYEEETA